MAEIEIDGKKYPDGSIPGFSPTENEWFSINTEDINLVPQETNQTKIFENAANGDWRYPGTER